MAQIHIPVYIQTDRYMEPTRHRGTKHNYIHLSFLISLLIKQTQTFKRLALQGHNHVVPPQDTQASQTCMLSFWSQLRQTKMDPTGIFQCLVTYHAAVPCYQLLCPSASLNVPRHKTKNIQLPYSVRVSVSVHVYLCVCVCLCV